MRIAIVGAGRVGRALGERWAQGGHEVRYGVRDPEDPRHADLPDRGTVADVVAGSDAVLVALPWAVTEQVMTGAPVGDAVVMDATNPLAAGGGTGGPSGAELLARWTGSPRVVKAFNTTGSANMTDPAYPGAAPMMPIAGDDDAAKTTAMSLATELGFDAVDAGPLSAALDLEHLAALWIRLAYPLGNGPGIAFALLRRDTAGAGVTGS